MSSKESAAEFLDYVDNVKRKKEEKEALEEVMRWKQEWRKTTYAGMLIALVERMGAADFFESIGNSLEGGDDRAAYYAVKIIYRIGMITASIMFVFFLGYLMKMFIGEELVIEQEVVIIEEVTRSQYEAEQREKEKKGIVDDESVPITKTRSSTTTTTRRRRGKRD